MICFTNGFDKEGSIEMGLKFEGSDLSPDLKRGITFASLNTWGKVFLVNTKVIYVGEWGWGVEGKQVGSMDEEPQVRGCYNITFICTPANQETVSVLEKTQANKTFRT